MKKAIIIFNQYLSHFWFTILLLVISFLYLAYQSYFSVNYWQLDSLVYIKNLFGGFLFSFLLPLGVISVFIALPVWIKDKSGNSYQGFVAIMLMSLTIALSFVFVSKLSAIESGIIINQQMMESEVILKNAQMNKLK